MKGNEEPKATPLGVTGEGEGEGEGDRLLRSYLESLDSYKRTWYEKIAKNVRIEKVDGEHRLVYWHITSRTERSESIDAGVLAKLEAA